MIDLTNFEKLVDPLGKIYYKMKKDKPSKHCLITLSDPNFTEKSDGYFKYTHAQFVKYANKYDLDYIIMISGINEISVSDIVQNKFRLGYFFEYYERIFFADADVYIRDNARNLFDVVPEDKFGIFFESEVMAVNDTIDGYYRRWLNENKQLLESRYNIKISDVDKESYNTGIMIIPKKYRNVVSPPDIDLRGALGDQEELTFIIQLNKTEMFSLDRKFAGSCLYFHDESKKFVDILLGAEMIHFMSHIYMKKKERIRLFLEAEKNIIPPKQIIFSRLKRDYPPDLRDIILEYRCDKLSFRNGKREGSNITGLAELIEYINRGNRMVEIGPYVGEATELFAKRFNEVNSVGFANGDASEQRYEQYFDDRVSKYPNIKKIKEWPDKACNLFENESLDFVYIAGRTDYDWVKNNIELWFDKVKKGGYIGGFNYLRGVYPNVIKAIIEKFGNIDVLFDDGSWLVKKENQIITKSLMEIC